ncbi:hypothetical protein ISS37_03090 [candidate division KSB1 bacterium]|nr:hypothetical protein [candidate division KSB1 bacterium]
MSSDKLQAIISEYQMLREEIQRRSTDQMHCVVASVLSIGVLISLIAQNPTKYSPVLIVIPWILAVFGIIWLDCNCSIFLLGQYIRDEIEGKKLPALLESSEINWIGWQHYIYKKREKWKFPSYIVFILPFFYFVIPSIVCVIAYIILRLYGIITMPKTIEWCFLAIGIIFIIILLYSWYKSYETTKGR